MIGKTHTYRSRSLRIALAGLAAVVALGASSTSFAAPKYWIASGGAKLWSTPTNWSPNGVPGITDDVILSNTMSNNDVMIDLNVDIASLTVQNGYAKDIGPTGSQTIRIRGDVIYAGAAGFSLTASVAQIDGNLTVNSGELRTGAGTTLIGGNATLADQLTASSGPVTITGTMTISGSNGRYDAGSGALTVGAMVLSGGQFNGGSSATGTVTVTGDVTVSGTHTFTASSNAAATVRIGGTLAIAAGTFTANSGRLEVGGFNKTGGTFTHSSGQVMLNGTTSQTFASNGATFNNLTINDGLVGYWKLDDASASAVDSSGYGNNLTWTASPTSSSSVPSLLFTNTVSTAFATADRDALLTAMPSTMQLALPITLSAWYRATAIDTNAGDIISGKDSYVLRLTSTGIGLAKHTGGDVWSELSSTTSGYLDGNWHHVVGVLNSTGGMSIYYDGALVASNTNTAAVNYTNTGGANLAIGRNGGGNTGCDFGGNIDDVRIYKRALSVQEIKSLARGAEPATGVATHTMTGAPIVLGNLVLASGTLAGSSAISVRGSWLNYGGRFTSTGTVTLTGTSATGSILSGGQMFSALTLNGTGGTYTLADRLWVTDGTVTLTAGTLNTGSYVSHVGSFAGAAAGFAPATGTVVLDPTSDKTLSFGTFYGLRLEDASEASLAAYWKLDEGSGPSARDWSGSGNTGTLSSGASWTTSSGSTSFDNAAAVTFDGAAGYVSGGTTGVPAANAAQTISVWANFSSATTTQSMVALTATGSAIRLGLSGGAVQVLNSGGTVLATATAPSAGAWHHIAYVYDPSQATAANRDKIYIDGTATTGTSGTHNTATPTAAFIGATSASANFFNGRLDDVRIYSAALTSAQVTSLAAGRYPGTGGYATVTLGTNLTVTNTFAVDAANLTTSTFTFNPSLTTAAAAINAGTYTVGSAAQTFPGGLTVQRGGAMTMATSGGSVQIATGKTLTMDGTLNASSTGATIRSVSGTYAFTVGSTAGATPTLNITGLAVQNTDGNGMRINGNTAAVTTFTRFDNIAFTAGTTRFLNIYATSLYLASSGCSFGIGDAAAALPTNNVTLTGNGTADGDTRIVFGGATCHANQTTNGYCNDSWAIDDDANNDGVGDPSPSGNEAVVQYVRGAGTDTAGTVEGFPTAAFDWNTFAYYSTYVAFHDVSGTVDRVYVRTQTGGAEYSWDTPSGEQIVGTPRWNTDVTTHYLYVATASGKVYRLIDNGTSLVQDNSGSWAGAANPYDCGCTIVTPLTVNTTNLYWGGINTSPVEQRIWTVSQSTQGRPMGSPFTITPTITSASPALWVDGTTNHLMIGLTGNLIKLNVSNQTLNATNTSPGSASIVGRISTSTTRIFAADSGGNVWAFDPNNFTGTNRVWQHTVGGTDTIQGSILTDQVGGVIHFGTEQGKVGGISVTTGATQTGYPFVPGTTSDAIRSAPLYINGILLVGTTTGKMFIYDRNNGTTGPAFIRQYYFGPTQAVSGVSYDSNVQRYMVSTADPTTKDGRVYFIDAITDPTAAK